MSKRESVEEFLQRGGSITVLPKKEEVEEDLNKAMPTTGAGGGIMTLAEGALYHAEQKVLKPRKKKEVVINFSALPASLLKFVKNKPA